MDLSQRVHRSYWLALGACYGTMIGHITATISNSSSRFGPENNDAFWWSLGGLILGVTIGAIADALTRHLGNGDDASKTKCIAMIEFNRFLWLMLPIVFILYGLLIPAVYPARE